ncbi:MAG TPA: glycosyltransferase family 4 protein [Terracidiphilus sp.]|nr:glycosyltransferase family 4 protein [Terracidiphilus sp.]
MSIAEAEPSAAVAFEQTRSLIVIGITHPQSCLLLSGRLRALREAGFRVVLLCAPGKPLDRVAKSEGVETIAIPMERGIAPLRDMLSLFRLWRVLRQLQPDIVEFSTPKAGFLGMVAATLARVPERVYLLRGLKLESTSGFKRRLLCAAERVASLCAHHVLCNSASLTRVACDLRLVDSEKLLLLGDGSSNGVDVVRFAPGASDVRRNLGLPPDAPVLGFVGRLTRDKGVRELFDAFEVILKARPSVYLLLVGWFDESDDALSGDLRRRIERHPRIVCTGFVEDTAPYYQAMDVFVLPTWREGMPNAVLEASASGIPVITTWATGARDSVVDGVTGVLIPPGNREAIYRTALQLLREPEQRRRMGAAGRAWVSESFRQKDVLRRVVGFYQGLAPGPLNADPMRCTITAPNLRWR